MVNPGYLIEKVLHTIQKNIFCTAFNWNCTGKVWIQRRKSGFNNNKYSFYDAYCCPQPPPWFFLTTPWLYLPVIFFKIIDAFSLELCITYQYKEYSLPFSVCVFLYNFQLSWYFPSDVRQHHVSIDVFKLLQHLYFWNIEIRPLA